MQTWWSQTHEDSDLLVAYFSMEFGLEARLPIYSGGLGALAALGIAPTVFYVNEGHSAFLAIERARSLVEDGMSTDEALERIRQTTVFTTHTPVPAGNEVFGDELVIRYVGKLAERAGLSHEALLALGRSKYTDGFCLTTLSLLLTAYSNALS